MNLKLIREKTIKILLTAFVTVNLYVESSVKHVDAVVHFYVYTEMKYIGYQILLMSACELPYIMYSAY